jgi:hypothetical protein
MPEPVPVASNLLESKFLGFSVRRLVESMALPVAPCVLLYTVGFPLLVTFPLFVLGIGVGGLIFTKTPPGQRPLRYAHAVARYRTSSNVYVWTPSTALENHFARGLRQNDWLTHPTTPGLITNSLREIDGAEETAERSLASAAQPTVAEGQEAQ